MDTPIGIMLSGDIDRMIANFTYLLANKQSSAVTQPKLGLRPMSEISDNVPICAGVQRLVAEEDAVLRGAKMLGSEGASEGCALGLTIDSAAAIQGSANLNILALSEQEVMDVPTSMLPNFDKP